MAEPDLNQQLAQIRVRFSTRIEQEIPLIHELMNGLAQTNQSPETLKQLLFYVHRYNGNGSTFGFPLVSERAREMELLLTRMIENPDPSSIPTLQAAYVALEEALLQVKAF